MNEYDEKEENDVKFDEDEEFKEFDDGFIDNYEPLDENDDANNFFELNFDPNDEDEASEEKSEVDYTPMNEVHEKKVLLDNIKKKDIKKEIREISQNLKEVGKRSQNTTNNFERNSIKSVKPIKSTRDLLDLLRYDLENKLPKDMIIDGTKINMFSNGRLPWNKLSYIMTKYGHRVKRINRNIRLNPDYKVALDELEEWKYNLRSTLKDKSIDAIKLINNYCQSNHDLPISSKYKVLNFHPNLKIDYFNQVNSKEKAYWLGFLWGELYIGRGSALSLELSKKDEKLMDRYIRCLGLNPEYKYPNTKERKSGIKKYIRMRFKCPQMAKDLLDLGYKPSSLKQTEFPKLNTRELDLAFVLGFFDAEGKEGTTSLHLGSKKILDQIKERFDLPHNVYPDKEGYWYFSLGSKFFNKIMDNYKNSLERKRRLFRVPLRQVFEESITKDELQDMIWTKPIKEISKM
jgi:hypothetical protein